MSVCYSVVHVSLTGNSIKHILFDIDDKDWEEFSSFCRCNGIKYRIVSDYDDGVVVSLNFYDGLKWAMFTELGE